METSAALELAKHTLLLFGIILGMGTFSGLLARLVRVPDVVVFLLVGMLLGPGALGLVDIKADSTVNQLILIFGSSYILFDGGASIRLRVLKEVWITIVVIATVGVLITAAITGVAAYYFLGVPVIVALLLGATLASTDPATLVPVFKQVKIKERVAQTVMSESAFNDAMGAIVTFTVLGVAMGAGEFSAADALLDLLKQSLFGIAIGGVMGYLAAVVIAHERFNFLAEFAPVVTLMAVIGAYMSADGLHSSGFMAVFVFGIMLGNVESLGFRRSRTESHQLEDFVMTTSLIMRDLGAKPCHEDRLLRGWSQVCSYDRVHSPAENFLPLALRNELPAIEAELNGLAKLSGEYPAGEGVARLLVELRDGQMVESVLLPRGGLCV